MQMSAEDFVRTLFRKGIAKDGKQTDFAVASCPASVLSIVNMGIPGCV